MSNKNFRISFVTLISLIAIFAIIPASAHHNYVSHYDMKAKPVDVEGTVHSFWFVNPHMRIYIEVANEETGKKEMWVAEGRSRNILAREGWKGDEIQKGQAIRVSGTPARTEKMRTHILLKGGIEVDGQRVNAGALEKKIKDFQLGGDGAATSGSHLDSKSRKDNDSDRGSD